MDTLHELKFVGRGAGTEKPYSFAVSEKFKVERITTDAPLMTLSDNSGFIFSYVGGGSGQSAFLNHSDFAEVREITHATVLMMLTYKPLVQENGVKCYTVRFKMGNFKGKSPAELLSNKEATPEDLQQQITFLQQNVAKYPSNQEIIDAANEAISLFKAEKLGVTESTITDVYHSGTRYYPQTDKEGFHTGWELDITCNLAEKAVPYTVTITRSRVKVGDNYMILQNTDKKMYSISLTKAEWLDFIDCMDDAIKNIKTIYFPAAWKTVMENQYKG